MVAWVICMGIDFLAFNTSKKEEDCKKNNAPEWSLSQGKICRKDAAIGIREGT